MYQQMKDIDQTSNNPWAVFLIFLRLGLTSFGGPVAHLSYFRDEFVLKRRWLSERSYADLVALCQFLPGPASSQVGMALGLSRCGYIGAAVAWAGFTMPSAIMLMLFAFGISSESTVISAGALHGLKVVAVAVVAQAVWGMARNLCQDVSRITIMAASACLMLTQPSAWGQVGVIGVAALAGRLLFKPESDVTHESFSASISHRAGLFWLTAFVVILLGLPFLTTLVPDQTLMMTDGFYRAGALVFGGGHVVLPLLQTLVVPTGWVSNESFLAGYGAAQAVPGPLFTFAAFLGASMDTGLPNWLNGLIGLFAVFAPSFLLVAGALPSWDSLRRNIGMQAALAGINAAVVGLLLAALYQPVWISAIHAPQDFAFALVAFIALLFWNAPPWVVVIISGVVGHLIC